jgi:hypothetical protein
LAESFLGVDMQKSSLMLAALLLMAACSKAPQEQLDEGTQMDQLFITSVLQRQSADASGEALRNERFSILTDQQRDAQSKLVAAEEYLQSFEGEITPVVQEFTLRLEEIYRQLDIKRMNPRQRGRKHSSQRAFYALAAALDTPLKAGRKGRPLTFYQLIKSALVKDVRREAMLPHEEILTTAANKEMMLELIKARVDILSAMALELLTDQSKMGPVQKTKGRVFNITRGRLGEIDLPEVFNQADEQTKNQIERLLGRAVMSRGFLAQIGVTKELERQLASAFSNLDWIERPSAADSEERRKYRIMDLINQLQ